MAQRVQARPALLRPHQERVAHGFGTMKRPMQHGSFVLKTLPTGRAAFSLTVLPYNRTRVIAIVGVPKLLSALHDHPRLAKVGFDRTGLHVLVPRLWWIHRWFYRKTTRDHKCQKHPCGVFTQSDAGLGGAVIGDITVCTCLLHFVYKLALWGFHFRISIT